MSAKRIRQDILHQELTRLRQETLSYIQAMQEAREGLALDDSSFVAFLHTARTHIIKFDEAIKKNRKGQYGRCCKCGGNIGLRRLRALPFSKYCEACFYKNEYKNEEDEVRKEWPQLRLVVSNPQEPSLFDEKAK